MNENGKRFLIAGTGLSGSAAYTLLKKKGIDAVVYDSNEALNIEELRRNKPEFQDARILTGNLKDDDLALIDIAVLSPGISTELPAVEQMRNKGIEIWGEIELAYTFAKGRILAITGTNGKTTTTALLGEIMKNYFEDVKIVGNIGIPYTSVANATTQASVTVAEISSFQLETIHTFKPEISAILNISPDHLNRHHTMENYIRTKETITKNQGREDLCVLNYESAELREFAKQLDTRVLFFSSERILEEGISLDGDRIILAIDQKMTEICKVGELNLLGKHNYENVMAAAGMALGFGVPLFKIQEVLKCFQGVEHRIEYVTQKRGIKFYNDSKGTNPDAAIKAIQAMNRPTFLIGGGYDKDSDYGEWIDAFDGKVKKLVLIGQTREKIAETAKRHGFCEIVFADSLVEAVTICYDAAVFGDAILLSPACASWGMFKDYEERGKIFKDIVSNLKE